MKRLAVALAMVLALTACAVTGQPAHRGTAAIYDGNTITTADVAAWGAAETEMGLGYDPGAVLTLQLLRPALQAECARQGMVFGEDAMTMEARMWMASNKAEVKDPTPDMLDLVTTVRMIYALLQDQDGAKAVTDALKSIEADAKVNPMYGPFSADVFVDSVATQAQEMQDESSRLSEAAYLVFRELSGFKTTAQRDWMVDEAPEAATASAIPSPSPSPAS